jgi:catechol 2,3-dioxygenase-like lactoylglutathione lyase family enzyme
MESIGRPGPKPKRLYLRLVRQGEVDPAAVPERRAVRAFLDGLERNGRFVAHGELTNPPGDLLVLRATDLPEAQRVLRSDPFRDRPGAVYEILEWHPTDLGLEINLEPPPGKGSGRLTGMQRVAVFVRDQEAALRWYTEVLGLTVRERDVESGYVELAFGRGGPALSLVAPREAWGEPYVSEGRARIGQSTGIVFQTDSIPALELRLVHARARITQEPRGEPWGGVTLRFADPDGNEFLAFQREPLAVTARPRRAARAP